mmetsp:Transcript_112174/g.350732  ORF Transcript_112174/g.350732 Transcript_112174/m.350732 type:complete len:152 (-) Transcript_112174:30-485(-)
MECVAGNLTGYSRLKHFEESGGPLQDFHHDFMAQYCFELGHCTNPKVHDGMTLAEAEAMCDEEYGHSGWASFTRGGVTRTRLLSILGGTLKMKLFGPDGLASVKVGKPSARGMGKIACARGHYHCDVQSCKDNYCSNPKYWKRYHHRLPGQ